MKQQAPVPSASTLDPEDPGALISLNRLVQSIDAWAKASNLQDTYHALLQSSLPTPQPPSELPTLSFARALIHDFCTSLEVGALSEYRTALAIITRLDVALQHSIVFDAQFSDLIQLLPKRSQELSSQQLGLRTMRSTLDNTRTMTEDRLQLWRSSPSLSLTAVLKEVSGLLSFASIYYSILLY